LLPKKSLRRGSIVSEPLILIIDTIVLGQRQCQAVAKQMKGSWKYNGLIEKKFGLWAVVVQCRGGTGMRQMPGYCLRFDDSDLRFQSRY
jgi:hypothetical protein